AGVVGIPVGAPTWPPLLVDIEDALWAVEGKGGHLAQPGQPGGSISWLKILLQLALGVPLIAALFAGPDEGVTGFSGHTTVLCRRNSPQRASIFPNPPEPLSSITLEPSRGPVHGCSRLGWACSSGDHTGRGGFASGDSVGVEEGV